MTAATVIQCQCCGVNGRHDFDNATKWHRVMDSLLVTLVPGNMTEEVDVQHIPLSCCSLLNHTASYFPANVSRLLFTNLTVCQLTGSPAVTHTAVSRMMLTLTSQHNLKLSLKI